MASATASLVVGGAHPNHGGIIPGHILYLFENSRPAWWLETTGPGRAENAAAVSWIPGLENMLEDGLLMVALFVLRDERLTALVQQAARKPLTDQLVVPEDLDPARLPEIYQTCREVLVGPKIVLTLLEGSSIAGHTPVLADYRMDVEVCRPTFSRHYSAWREGTVTTGTL